MRLRYQSFFKNNLFFFQGEPIDLNWSMNISVLNALWSILVGEKLDLDDPKLKSVIEMFDNLLKINSGATSPVMAILPHPSMAKLPGSKYVQKCY
jgi:hypothetical protein